MKQPNVLGVLAGKDMPLEQLRIWAESADFILAADQAADTLRRIGVKPNLIVGDFDSIQEDHDPMLLQHDPNQDSTDCDKLLAKANELGYEQITLVSIEGDQLDHMIATLHSAIRNPIQVRVALRTGIGWVLNDHAELTVETIPGRRVSLLPLAECMGVTLTGVEWPVHNETLSPTGRTSISNRASNSTVYVQMLSGAALLYVERVLTEPPLW